MDDISYIEQRLQPYYSKSLPIKINEFILFEMAITVLLKFNLNANPQKGYILFTKYQNIGKKNFNSDDYTLQNANIILKKFQSEKLWNDTLNNYIKENYNGIRLFEIKENKFLKNSTDNLSYGNREKDYLKYINSYTIPEKTVSYASSGNYTYYNKNSRENIINITLKTPNLVLNEKLQPKSKRKKIKFTLKELIDAADEMQKIIPQDHCATVLRNNIIKKVSSDKLIKAQTITIDKITNIIGMVGSGKTTFLKAITYLLTVKKYKIAIITDTVYETFNLYKYFKKLGCDCSPLIGKYEREKYINQFIKEDEFYLDKDFSEYLTPNCIIDGLDDRNEFCISYGSEPCTRLKKDKTNFICPYFNKCPATKMQRNAIESNIVITTVAGFIKIKVGAKQKVFMQEVIDLFDLVIFDECDRVQKSLDELFIPSTYFNDFIKESAEEFKNYMLLSNDKRMKDSFLQQYRHLQSKSPTILTCLVNAVETVKSGNKKYLVKDTFSAYTLLENIKGTISDNTIKEINLLSNFLTKEYSALSALCNSSCNNIINKNYQLELNNWLDLKESHLKILSDNEIKESLKDIKDKKIYKQRYNDLKKERSDNTDTRNIISLIIILIYFNHYINDIEFNFNKIQTTATEANELVSFVKNKFLAQQDYLPASLMGKIFSLKLTEDKDIIIYRQYAYGRSLLTDLPYLKIDKKGNPLGPHALLLSGSSYAEGSYEYHVNAKVNYIIETDKKLKIRKFISKTEFYELGLDDSDRVSGSPLDKRLNILKTVADKCTQNIISELKRDTGKVLIVVNSFEQAEFVANRLREKFRECDCNDNICTMISDKNTENNKINNNYIKRGEIYKFHSKEARVLVAPALAIERGHNIVDEDGHSTLSSVFFMIRPMGVPDDINNRSIKMNGYIASKCLKYEKMNPYDYNLKIREEAISYWERMSDAYKTRLDYLDDEDIKTDIVSTMFILILQIFGRLCRITDISKTPPRVYFVDGAFRGRKDDKKSFDTLNEFYKYLNKLLSDKENGIVAKTLYEPFFNAYKKEIKYD